MAFNKANGGKGDGGKKENGTLTTLQGNKAEPKAKTTKFCTILWFG